MGYEEEGKDKRSCSDDDKERRSEMIRSELDRIFTDADDFVVEHLEEDDMDPEAKKALKIVAFQLAYRKQYYDAVKDEIIWFPSVSKLIMKGELTDSAEDHYYDDEDEWPLEYTKALKTVVRNQTAESNNNEIEIEIDEENDAYMEKPAFDIEFKIN